MIDSFGRRINYLRVSVTDRCNLRCLYCMPAEGIDARPKDELLTHEEIVTTLEVMADLGIGRVRITGGEPLVRRGIVDLIRRIAAIPGIEDLSLSTNGLLFAPMARELREAGVRRVNISLDTLRPDRFAYITRLGGFEDALASIDAALAHGYDPVKLNCVVLRDFNTDELVDFARLTVDRPLHVRFIELMPVGEAHPWAKERWVPYAEIVQRLEAAGGGGGAGGAGGLVPAQVPGGGPAEYYRWNGGVGTVGFIHAISNHFCGTCNRLRLTADGKLNPCLGSLTEVDIRTALRGGASREELRALFAGVIAGKPERHFFVEYMKELGLEVPEYAIKQMSRTGG